MPLRSEALEEPQLNLTPMIDVVLNLVIFFMLGTQFVDNERKYDVNLPVVSAAQPLTERPDEIVVNISKAGEIFVSGQVLTVAELEQKLSDAQSKYAEQAVIIRGDGECVYQYVMTILDICQRANISQLQMATRVEPSLKNQ